MTSSNYYDIRIRKDGQTVLEVRLDALQLPWTASEPLAVRAEEAFSVAVHRPAGGGPRLRCRLGNELIAEVPADVAAFETETKPWLVNEVGESRVAVEEDTGQGAEDEAAPFALVVEVRLDVTPRPEVARDFRVMLEDVMAIHEGLAQDVLNRAFLRRGLAGTTATRLHPEAVLAGLREQLARLQRALAQIARQPSVRLDRAARLAFYRGGDRLDAAAVAEVARDARTRIDPSGRVAALGKLRVRVPVLSEDLPEHRHAAEGLRRLARRADGLARHCERSADLVNREEARWGRARAGRPSVFAQHYLPRVAVLEGLARQAQQLAAGFRELLDQYAFLREAPPPRTTLGPTPAFLGRPAYREVYRTLVQAQQPLGALVDGDTIRIAYRNLATLYEYWCFLRTVAYLRQRLGAPQVRTAPGLVDEIYRPDLKPGQEFHFPAGERRTLVVTYEPEIRPWRLALQRGDRYGATLTRDPIRPDITLELRELSEPGVMLVLDAKSTDAFAFDTYRGMTDYARQVFDPRTWQQPVRQVFLLHRDRRAVPLINVPHHLQGQQTPAGVAILGAVPCVPEQVNRVPPALAAVIDRFLEAYAGALRDFPLE
jgi:hypothetical protein